MTGAAGEGRSSRPPGRLGLAWLLDTVAKLGDRHLEQADYRADSCGVAYQDPDGRVSRPGSTARRPDAAPSARP